MRVCGVIAEYDPFHQGHAYHLAQARQAAGADFVVCLISGCFTQRGAPALLSPRTRAEMALRGGADAVLQMPYAFSAREAEYFALGGVYTFQRLGCVTHLSFGVETSEPETLFQAARLLEAPDDALEARVQAGLRAGLSHAAAQGRAVTETLELSPGALSAPNNALGIAYLRALLRLKSELVPLPVLRQGAYHAAEVAPFPAASAVRRALLRGDWQGVWGAIPAPSQAPLRRAALEGALCPPDALDGLLRAQLLSMGEEALARLPGIGEGLERRIARAAAETVSREALIDRVKTRRYTRGRISRALCHALMRVSAEDLPALPGYARLLGFREGARPLLRRMQESGFPLYSRPARAADMALDIRADELWRIGAGLPRGEIYREAPVILP